MGLYDEMRHYYENEGQEEYRLHEDGIQHLEYQTMVKYLDLTMPPKARVLDNCAGTGIYSLYLANRGYQVTAGDIIPYNVEILEQKQKKNPVLSQVYFGDAKKLPQFEDGYFDVILCMGALYHLPDPGDRRETIRECLRLLAPDGLLFCTYMNRYAVIMNNFERDLNNIEDVLQFSDSGIEGIFYASTVPEMEQLMTEHHIKKEKHISLDGMAYFLVHKAKILDDRGFEKWKEYHFHVCEEESLLGSSYHNLFVGRKT